MAPFSTVPLSSAIHQGALDPIQGWVSSHYGRRRPAPVVVYGATGPLPVRVATLLLPVEHMAVSPPTVRPLLDGGQLVGLHLVESGETVRFEPEATVSEPVAWPFTKQGS